MSSIIEVKNLSKSYIISHEGRETYTALRDVIAKNTKKFFSFSKPSIGNNITKEEFWALKDISFDIYQGDRVGIIGRNGAGKSTLLKILSRITEPTSGEIKIKGRVASLLEVGTGFHPELTGRENIFLNGAILGMSRAEIRSKFDEIVDFAEVEQFLDTPVKRYSSGMYVRLAFAVAAHLEPEVLVVDEVLAVGDVQFQKKCLGKMQDVSKNEGRTVLFVSHNMGMITQLCNRGILLKSGEVKKIGTVDEIINQYLFEDNVQSDYQYHSTKNSSAIYFMNVVTRDIDKNFRNSFSSEEAFILEAIVKLNEKNRELKIGLTIQSKSGDYLSTLILPCDNFIYEGDALRCIFLIKQGLLVPNNYFFRVAAFSENETFDVQEMICPISITDGGTKMAQYEGKNYGYFNLNYKILGNE